MNTDGSTQRRFFTEPERRAAFIAANGLCQICGCQLGTDFHADHIKPFAAGGETGAGNLQALCPACNLTKGARVDMQTMPTRAGREPRPWQQEAFQIVMQASQRSALVQATPGAGKTGLACGVARAMMDRARINRVLVVSPLTTLKEDWARDLSAVGIDVDPHAAGGMFEARDYQGRSLTYSTLSFIEGRTGGAYVEAVRQAQTRTMVILDEVHHAADKASWGQGLKQACGHAAFVLCLSGTPFRTDGQSIPFVQYDQDGNAIADFIYSYSSAIADKVCRPVFFPAYEGSLEWLSGNEIYLKSFADELDEQQQSQRLRTALQSEDWIIKQLTDAQQRLSDIRASHPAAGGLVVAMNQAHARHIAEQMRKVTFSRPVLVLSDDKDADEQLQAFRDGVDPWVIAVRKVSEGVDIPRLRVCVYMTNVITEMFFRQVVGRVVRYTPGIAQQEAFVYIPADRRLVEMALRIQEERLDAALKMEESGEDDDDSDDEQTERELTGESDFYALGGTAWHESTITYNGHAFSLQEIEAAKVEAAKYGLRPEIMALMIRDGWRNGAHGQAVNGNNHHPDPNGSDSLFERKRALKRSPKIKALKSEVRHRFLGHLPEDQQAFKHLNMALNRAVGARSKEQKTEDQSLQQLALLEAAVRSTEVPSWLR